jgi:hypothetical protein
MCLTLVLKAAELNVDNAEDCGGYDIKVVVVQGSKKCTVNHKDAHKVQFEKMMSCELSKIMQTL